MEDRIIEIIEEISEFKDLKNNKNIDLIENEVLDSLGFIEFVSKIEEEFDIEIQPTQIDPTTWKSIDKIIDMIKKIKSNTNNY